MKFWEVFVKLLMGDGVVDEDIADRRASRWFFMKSFDFSPIFGHVKISIVSSSSVMTINQYETKIGSGINPTNCDLRDQID